jgi:hypothetical protein
VGTWHDPDLGRPIAAPLERCAELLGVDLATVRELAANVDIEQALQRRHDAGGAEDRTLLLVQDDPLAVLTGAITDAR